MNIQISNEFLGQIESELINSTAKGVLEYEKISSQSEISIVIENDQSLQELNSQFLGIDAPTDVLSFPSDEIDPESGEPYLGDIIISLPRAKAQATDSGHPLEAEVQLLVIHGVLHLLGYDHAEDDDKKEMWEHQKDILSLLNVPLRRFPE